MQKMFVRGWVCIFMTFLVGCGSIQTKPDDQIVSERAQKRLDALLAQDFEKAYSYASPAYRKSVSLSSHKRYFLGAKTWTEAVVESVTCDQDVCDVMQSISYRPQGIPSIKDIYKTSRTDRWIKVDGIWWVYHKLK